MGPADGGFYGVVIALIISVARLSSCAGVGY